MAYEPRMIAPFSPVSGLSKYYKPWIIGKEAFPSISDAYARRGVVRKREGYRLLASLPSGDKPVQSFGTFVNPSTLGEVLTAFSKTKIYKFVDGSQSFTNISFDPSAAPVTFTNGNNDYFWTCNFASSMWITNNLVADHIKYYNGSNTGICTHQPQVNGTPTYLNACLIILPYKGRLIVLNTTEGASDNSSNNNFQSRARWAQIGTPYTVSDGTHVPPTPFAVDANAWRDDIPGKGGFIDADTNERIVSASIVKDTLIVFFQRSTWRLTYTGQELLPFIWERLNTQFGSESTYSTVSFDEAALTFSRFGWIGSSTSNVERIDMDIPDDSFAIEGTDMNVSGLRKVQGIRDFFREFAYWTYIPISQTQATQIYGFNYREKAWTVFNPTVGINCFGYYRNTAGDYTWSTLNGSADTWENYNTQDDTWSSFGSGQNEDFPYVVGGDLNGNVYLMFEFFQQVTTDNGTNFKFSIFTKRMNPYIEQGLKCRLGYVDLYCTALAGGEITVNHYVDDQSSPVITKTVEIFSRGVVNITSITPGSPTTIVTGSDHNLSTNETVTIADVVGSVGKLLNNQTFVATVTNPTTFTIPINTTGLVYTQAGYTYSGDLPQGDSRYTRIYLGAIAHMHQIQFTLSSAQVADPVKGTAQFEMQALVIWTKSCGRVRG